MCAKQFRDPCEEHEDERAIKQQSQFLLLKFPCRNYGTADAAEGKAAAKAELRARMGLSGAEAPLVAVVTRLTHQKGIHLIKHAAWRTLERGAQFVLLGSAPDPRVQVLTLQANVKNE